MLKRLKKNKHVNDEMLREGLLAEGGGRDLNPANLAALDADYAAGDQGAAGGGGRSKSRASDETRIEGLE